MERLERHEKPQTAHARRHETVRDGERESMLDTDSLGIPTWVPVRITHTTAQVDPPGEEHPKNVEWAALNSETTHDEQTEMARRHRRPSRKNSRHRLTRNLKSPTRLYSPSPFPRYRPVILVATRHRRLDFDYTNGVDGCSNLGVTDSPHEEGVLESRRQHRPDLAFPPLRLVVEPWSFL